MIIYVDYIIEKSDVETQILYCFGEFLSFFFLFSLRNTFFFFKIKFESTFLDYMELENYFIKLIQYISVFFKNQIKLYLFELVSSSNLKVVFEGYYTPTLFSTHSTTAVFFSLLKS